MKTLRNYISEKLVINKNYDMNMYSPKTPKELRQIIEERYKELGPGTEQKPIDFNDIDVTEMTTFYDDQSNKGLFQDTQFEYIDISDWDVSSIEDISTMFRICKNLKSVGDLSKWNVSGVSIGRMFDGSGITNIPDWYNV